MIVVYTCVTYTSMYISIHACMNEYVYVCNFLQVCLEGQISRRSVLKSFSEGHQPSGDQIPWKFSEQFRDAVFPSLSGARIVRIATHPSAMRVIFCFMDTFGFDLLAGSCQAILLCLIRGHCSLDMVLLLWNS